MKTLFTILFLFLASTIYSQDNISSTLLKGPVIIDGVIDSQWMEVDSISIFYQLEPDYGNISTRRTTVKVAQFNDKLYFLFICYTNSSDEIVAKIQQRDKLNMNDDIVSVLLDTYKDNHNAVLFQINPLGTIADAKITSDGKSIDYLWDTEWEAKAAIDSVRWIAEIMVPLNSFQFNSKKNVFGCNFSRSIRANQEIAWWQKITENYRVSQSGQLSNLQFHSKTKHNLKLFPYGTVRYEDSDITENENTVKGDIGMDIQYKYGSNVKANVTVNPDFATVEGDKEQINLTPWELKFPEKRLFFQDGNEMFGTRIQTFYSRRIGDIFVGGKATGKIGKYQFNGLYAYTKENTETDTPSEQFSAFRVKRDILKSSNIGFTYTDKITDTLTFHTFSADYTFNLGKEWKLTGQYVGSIPGSLKSHSAWFVRFARENNTYHYHVRYTELGDNFRENVNETGFIADDNRKEVDSDVNYKFWFKNKIKYLRLSGRNNIFWSQSGELRSWYLTYGGRCYMENRISLDLYYNNEYKNVYDNIPDDYYNHFLRAIVGYNTDENSFAEMSYRKGVNFKRNFDLLEFNTNFQLFKKVTVNYEFKYLNFEPDNENESTLLNVLGISYYQTKDLWFRIFTQHNRQTDRIYFYGLAGWRFKPPFGAVYLIYSSDNYQDLLTATQVNSNIVFLKLTYPIHIIN